MNAFRWKLALTLTFLSALMIGIWWPEPKPPRTKQFLVYYNFTNKTGQTGQGSITVQLNQATLSAGAEEQLDAIREVIRKTYTNSLDVIVLASITPMPL
jgi:hypothetical protein